MPRISHKLAVGGQLHGKDWKNICLNGTIIRELTARKCQTYQVRFDKIENVIVNVLAEEEEQVVTKSLSAPEVLFDDSKSSLEEEEEQNMNVIDLTSSYELFRRFLPLNYIEQFVIDSINVRGRDTSNWNKSRDYTTYDAPNFNDPLYSVRSFINAFNSNLIEALGEKNKIPDHRKIPRKPHPIGQEWKTVADGTAAYVLRLTRPWFGSGRTIVGDSWFGLPKLCLLLMESGLYSIFHVKKRRGWPLNYPQDMIQKLGNAYGSYFSKVAVVNGTHLIAASLKDRKPQCIIATASTTTQGDKVERVVKERNNSSLVKFARPKIFSEYSSSKGAIRDNMTSFHDVMRGLNWEMHVLAFLLGIAEANAFLSFKKWRNGAHDVSHFDFRRQLAFKILNGNYLYLEIHHQIHPKN
ncbi:24092_t:CDS:2, partial [Gigaspora rosea]